MITDQQPETEEEKPAEEPVVSESQDIGEGEKETVAEEEKSGDSLSTDNNAENELEVQAATNRWVRSGNRWWYCHRDGSYTKDDWEAINGVWYYFDQSGWMVTGWLKKPEGWYYLNPSTGAMATGWASINGKWYFLNSAGRMVTGWLSRSSGWYYLSDSGAMATGWQYIRNAWYYLEEGNGNMVTGWKQVGNNWYYLQSSGAWRQIHGSEILCKWKWCLGSGTLGTEWKPLVVREPGWHLSEKRMENDSVERVLF